MLQHEIRHPNGTFPHCRCGSHQRHIEARGALSTEPFDPMHPTGTRHALECRCGARTGWLPSLAAATSDWRQHFAAPEPRSNVHTILRLHRTTKETA